MEIANEFISSQNQNNTRSTGSVVATNKNQQQQPQNILAFDMIPFTRNSSVCLTKQRLRLRLMYAFFGFVLFACVCILLGRNKETINYLRQNHLDDNGEREDIIVSFKNHAIEDVSTSILSADTRRKLETKFLGVSKTSWPVILFAALVIIVIFVLIFGLISFCYSRWGKRIGNRNEQWTTNQDNMIDDDASIEEKSDLYDNDTYLQFKDGSIGGSDTSVSSTSTDSSYWASSAGGAEVSEDATKIPAILPPLDQGDEQRDDLEDVNNEVNVSSLRNNQDDMSISRASTVDGESYSQTERLANKSSSCVTELSDKDRVTHNTELSTLVQTPRKESPTKPISSDHVERNEDSLSTCSSLTNGSGQSDESGEAVDHMEEEKVHPTNHTNGHAATGEERDGPEVNVATAEQEQERSTSPTNTPTSQDGIEQNHAIVRDISFVPVSEGGNGTIGLGLDLEDASCPSSHPRVSNVGESSTFVGRIFPGDFITSVDEADTMGLSSIDVLKLIEGSNDENQQLEDKMKKMVKLSVASIESDGASSVSSNADEQGALDVDRSSTSDEEFGEV